jgi:hypothetical protein
MKQFRTRQERAGYCFGLIKGMSLLSEKQSAYKEGTHIWEALDNVILKMRADKEEAERSIPDEEKK